MDNRRTEYTLLWFIENYSYLQYKNRHYPYSQKYIIDGLEHTAWYLMLHPRGCSEEDSGNVSIFLLREDDEVHIDISLRFELSFLAADGSALHSQRFNELFNSYSEFGSSQFVKTDEIQLRRRAEFLPNDTLTVRCKLWTSAGDITNAVQISARSRLKIEKISFLHVIKNFSSIEPDVKQAMHIQSHSKEKLEVSSCVYFSRGSSCDQKIMIEIATGKHYHFLKKCELSLLDKSGNKVHCGGIDLRYGFTETDVCKIPLSLTRKIVLERKNEYLPGDNLSLLCKCVFSLGTVNEDLEETQYAFPLAIIEKENNQVKSKDVCKGYERFSENNSISEDMKTLYVNQCLTDVELKTKTKSFPAHKSVLCARSLVFKAMLTNDMREKNNSCIQIDDLENDTLQQLLLFLYTDKVENLQWETAIQLYYASDIYEVAKLKKICSTFLTQNLNASNASDLLHLADTHSDDKLKRAVEDFILEHEEEVFVSIGWEKLIEADPQLVIKTMHLKYKRKNESK